MLSAKILIFLDFHLLVQLNHRLELDFTRREKVGHFVVSLVGYLHDKSLDQVVFMQDFASLCICVSPQNAFVEPDSLQLHVSFPSDCSIRRMGCRWDMSPRLV